MPSACAATPGRERSRMRIAILNPSPSSPSRFAAGMRQSSNASSPVVEPEMPIFGSRRVTDEPAGALVEEQAEDVVLAVELDDVPRKLVRLVDLRRARRDARARERAHEVAQFPLFVSQLIPGHSRRLRRDGVSRRLDLELQLP